ELERVEAAVEAARKEEAQREARARREAQAAAARSTTAPGTPARPKTASQALGRMTAPGAAGRTSSPIPMQTHVAFSRASNVFPGFSTNLSEGGVFVATLNLLPVGTAVDLTFSLPGKVRISVQGEVRWTREVDDRAPDVFPGVGVRFVDLTPEAAQALRRFVADREPLFYPECRASPAVTSSTRCSSELPCRSEVIRTPWASSTSSTAAMTSSAGGASGASRTETLPEGERST